MEKSNKPNNINSLVEQMQSKSIAAISLPADEAHPSGSCQVYISQDLTYPDIVQLLCTLMFHAMNSFYQVYASEIRKANITTKVEANKKTARKTPMSEEQVMDEETLQASIANAAYQIHDSMNIAVSNVLNDFIQVDPNTAFLNPEDLITNEAILKAEQECLEELLSTLTPAQLAVANTHLQSLKEKISKARDDYAKMQLEAAQLAEESTNESDTEDAE